MSVRRPSTSAVAQGFLAALLVASSLPSAAQPLPPDAGADSVPSTNDVVVQSLGEGDQRIYLVNHGATWSMHAENVLAQEIFRLWHEAGGPEVVMKTALDYPFTMSVHRLGTERIVERLLDGYGYTLHFDENGRLELVRSYSPKPGRMFKTARLVESMGTWRQVETAKATLPGAEPESSAAPALAIPTAVAPPIPRPVPVPEPVDDPMAVDPEE